MDILHVVASVDEEAAGPSVSAPRLGEAQARAGARVALSTLAPADGVIRADATSLPHVRHPAAFARAPVIARLRLSPAMRADLLARAERGLDIVHGHGLWLMPNVYPAAAAASGACVVYSPRGMLGADALKFSAGRKRLFWLAAQRRAVAAASLLHATSEAEVDDIRAFGLDHPVVVAPNGVDVPPSAPPPEAAPPDAERTVLSLGRVHPKKGLDRLVAAWARVEAAAPGWRLRIVGPSELDHASALRALAGALGCARVSVEGPVFGADKLAAYRGADVFALPTLHENFAMTVAEALAAGTPVISTKGAPWAGLEREGCGLWIDHGPEAMAAALARLMGLPRATLAEMGARGRAWMVRDFSWECVAKPVLEAYAWARAGARGPTPASVQRG